MGKTLVCLVVDALSQQGLSACRAFPGRRMKIQTGLATAVQLHTLDQEKETATVSVAVVAPASAGAEVCEDGALGICRILQAQGGVCRLERAGYHKDGDIFLSEILATFSGRETENGWQETPPPAPPPAPEPEPEPEKFYVYVNGEYRPFAVSVEAKRSVTEETSDISVMPWSFVLEEAYPLEMPEGAMPANGFTIETIRNGRREMLQGCVIKTHIRELRKDAQHQIFQGSATSLVLIS